MNTPPLSSYLDAWRRWGDFKGSTGRADFWYAQGFSVLVLFALRALSTWLPVLLPPSSNLLGGALLAYQVIFYIGPNVSLCARRLRDAGRSPWLCVLMVWDVGRIILVIICCQRSRPAAGTPTAAEVRE